MEKFKIKWENNCIASGADDPHRGNMSEGQHMVITSGNLVFKLPEAMYTYESPRLIVQMVNKLNS